MVGAWGGAVAAGSAIVCGHVLKGKKYCMCSMRKQSIKMEKVLFLDT